MGLLGFPIAHSASPTMHEAAAKALGHHGLYQLIEYQNADILQVFEVLDSARRLKFSGLNITFPYKEVVVPLLDRLSPLADAVGAVNTVVIEGKELVGHNTDASGFASAAREHLGDVSGQSVVLVGTGGVGKAVAFALASLGVGKLILFDPDVAKAQALVAALKSQQLRVEIAKDLAAALVSAHGVVNGSPVGMLPNRDSPIPDHLLRADLWVADAVYYPLWTPLLLAAKAKGARIMSGRVLAIMQACDAFLLFTKLDVGLDVEALASLKLQIVAAMAQAFDSIIAAKT